jgi:hypothetical protein
MGFAERHAAAVKHTVITIEKTIGRKKRYLRLTTVMARGLQFVVVRRPQLSRKMLFRSFAKPTEARGLMYAITG